MSKQNEFPIHFVKSGEKFTHPEGFKALKDGINSSKNREDKTNLKKPEWLRIKVNDSAKYQEVREIVHTHRLSTVCEEAKCPNIAECWDAGTATIMLMGSVCTRACRFCSVDTGNPKGWLDSEEPANAAKSVELMGLKYIVLTSVDRDDLPDGGAAHYAKAVREIKKRCPETAVEVLAPDFQGNFEVIKGLLDSGISVFAQNVETVKRLTHEVRDPKASYETTLAVLAFAKKHNPKLLVKTSLMLGLGEKEDEILECMDDLRAIGVDILTFGQYLRPTMNHLPVKKFVTPEEFNKYRDWGLDKGFLEVVSGPFVRSSYRAERALEGNNVGL